MLDYSSVQLSDDVYCSREPLKPWSFTCGAASCVDKRPWVRSVAHVCKECFIFLHVEEQLGALGEYDK